MEFYELTIKETIQKNNNDIYKNLKGFLHDTTTFQQSRQYSNEHDVGREQASQVPTCLVITSSESASSIDTQFQAMFDELKNGAKALPIILDDKKCANLKCTVAHIQQRLRLIFNLTNEADNEPLLINEKEESGDELKIEVK